MNGKSEGKRRRKGRSGLINSYELGVNLNLSVPRLLVPGFLKSGKDRQERTHFSDRNGFSEPA